MENTSPPMRLSRRTLLEIFRRTKIRDAALGNPHEFVTVAVRITKAKLADQLVDGIKYEKIAEFYDQTLFKKDEVIEAWEDYLVPSEEIDGVGGTPCGMACRLNQDREGLRASPGKASGCEALHQAAALVRGGNADRQLQSRFGDCYGRLGDRRRPDLSRARN